MGCSSAEPTSASSGATNVNAIEDLKKVCKFETGLLTKKCKLFLGRDILLLSHQKETTTLDNLFFQNLF